MFMWASVHNPKSLRLLGLRQGPSQQHFCCAASLAWLGVYPESEGAYFLFVLQLPLLNCGQKIKKHKRYDFSLGLGGISLASKAALI